MQQMTIGDRVFFQSVIKFFFVILEIGPYKLFILLTKPSVPKSFSFLTTLAHDSDCVYCILSYLLKT